MTLSEVYPQCDWSVQSVLAAGGLTRDTAVCANLAHARPLFLCLVLSGPRVDDLAHILRATCLKLVCDAWAAVEL